MTDSLGGMTDFGPAPYSSIWNYAGIQRDPNVVPMYSNSPQVQALIDRGSIKREDRLWQNESGEGRYIFDSVDWTDPSLPVMGAPGTQGKFNWVPTANDTSGLVDPALIYNDPNYGQLTPSFNLKVDRKDWMDLLGPLAVGAITLGAGAIASGAIGAGIGAGAAAAGELTSVPWYISSGLSAAKQIGSGHPSLAGLGMAALPGLSDFGIPSELLSGASLASGIYGATQKSAAPATAITPKPFYDPTAFGDMGSMASPSAVSDGSQRVATAVAPDAYGNSYNSVTT